MSGLDTNFDDQKRSKAEYNWPPPNPKYAESLEYRDRPRYRAPQVPPARYQPPSPSPTYNPEYSSQPGPELLLRALWFLFVGWWLAILWLMTAYTLLITQVGASLGRLMVRNLPKILFLQSARPGYRNYSDNRPSYQPSRSPVALWQRLIWFVVVGWWLGILWTMAGYGLCTLVITEPIGMQMLEQLPAILTLEQQ